MMMMRFLFKNKISSPKKSFSYQRRTYSNNKTLFVGAFILVIIVFLWPTLVVRPLEWIGGPLWSIEKKISNSFFFADIDAYFTSKKKLKEQIVLLEKEVLLAESQKREIILLKEENVLLNTFLNRTVEEKDSVFAYILSRPNHTLYDTFLLDVGFESKVEPGDIVAYDEGQLLGEITEVRVSTSLAKLFSSPGTESRVVIDNSLASTAKGIGGGNLEITLPRDIRIEKGMSVRLEDFPATLLGRVESIEKGDSDTFQRILVRSGVNIFSLEGVLIYR